jgi:putative flippase GtrA
MLRIFKSSELGKISRYSLAGIVNTVLGVALFYVGSLTAIPYPVYTTTIYAGVTSLSYFVNRSFTFRSKDQMRREMQRYALFFAGNIVVAQGLQWVLIEALGMLVTPAVYAVMIVYTLIGYIGSRFYIYANPEGR